MNINTKGFTLIELLISISIISILSLMLLPNYGDFNKKNTLRQASLNLGNHIELVKNKALSGVYTQGSGCTGANLDNCKADWGIAFNCADNKYTLKPYIVGSSGQDEFTNGNYYNSTSDVKEFTLPTGVTFDSATCPSKWVFGRLNGLVVYPSSNSSIKLLMDGISDTVTINLDVNTASITYESN